MIPLSYRSPKTEVRESKIHGHGLFATADIAKDEIVAVKGGHIISREQLRSLYCAGHAGGARRLNALH